MTDPTGYEDDDTTAPDGDGRSDAAQERASALLEAAARRRGLTVRRLTEDLLLADRLAFRGLAGPGIGKVAQVLCGHDGWLRGFLAERGMPVVPTRLVDLGDGEDARRTAERLGMPVVARLATGEAAEAAPDAGSFPEVWRAVVAAAPDRRAQVILERRPAGEPVEVAVVAGRALAREPVSTPDAAAELAVRALAALPGAGYGSVRLVSDADGPLVDAVDLSLSRWVETGGGVATDLTDAILAYELDRSPG